LSSDVNECKPPAASCSARTVTAGAGTTTTHSRALLRSARLAASARSSSTRTRAAALAATTARSALCQLQLPSDRMQTGGDAREPYTKTSGSLGAERLSSVPVPNKGFVHTVNPNSSCVCLSENAVCYLCVDCHGRPTPRARGSEPPATEKKPMKPCARQGLHCTRSRAIAQLDPGYADE
jgi:hypothetical protein